MKADEYPRGDQQDLEQQLLSRLREAEQNYWAAEENYKRVLEAYGDQLQHPDGAHALRQAAAGEKIAMAKYHQALKAFSEFVVHGRRPPAESPGK